MPSTKPPKGTKDLLPTAARQRQAIVDVIERAYQAHGFEPLATPSIERLDALLGKYGDEGDQLIFRIMKRGANLARALGKDPINQGALADLGLRYDLTVPLARVAAEHQNELPKHFKRYQIQQVWRADRPAKGRFREFSQCDVDIVGCASLGADAEVLSAAATALRELGFKDAIFHTNHRDVLFGLIEAAGIDASLEGSTLVAVDKLDKIGWDGVTKELTERGLNDTQIAALRGMLETDGKQSNDAVLDRLERDLASSQRGAKGVAELRQLLALCAHSPAADYIHISPFLARGLSYYTGPIFEVKTPQLAGSIAAGGRYDRLVGMFLGRDVPAVGFSLGLERLEFVMDALGITPQVGPAVDVCVATFGDLGHATMLASKLRQAGLRVDLHAEDTRLGKQFKYAQQRGVSLVAFAGSNEAAEGNAVLKNLATGQQETLALDGLVEAIRAQLGQEQA